LESRLDRSQPGETLGNPQGIAEGIPELLASGGVLGYLAAADGVAEPDGLTVQLAGLVQVSAHGVAPAP
jgi:hypothetical protein